MVAKKADSKIYPDLKSEKHGWIYWHHQTPKQKKE